VKKNEILAGKNEILAPKKQDFGGKKDAKIGVSFKTSKETGETLT
jgi:hypothetical protein